VLAVSVAGDLDGGKLKPWKRTEQTADQRGFPRGATAGADDDDRHRFLRFCDA